MATATAAPAATITSVLGKPPGAPSLQDQYKIDKQLGKGSFGVVHLAHGKAPPSEAVAVKSLSKARLVCPEDVADVKAEVAILEHVGDHDSVVGLKGTYEDMDSVYLVLELCEGGELFDAIVEAGSFSEKQAAGVFRRMVEVIKHCHELGVMHRDLKPENFLLTAKSPDSPLKLADFGLSTFFGPGQRFKDLVGSPYYVAPEVLRKDYDHAADMWSLGVILYILLSGLPPFWGDTEEQIFSMVLKGNPDFEGDPWPKISAAAKDCVKRLLTSDPKKRATADEILHHEWLAREGAAPETPLGNAVVERIRRFAQMHRLKKMALLVVGQSLAPEELEGLRSLFKSYDADGSGAITVDEMKRALTAMGAKISADDLARIMAIADVSGDGLIDYNEFVAATLHVSKLEKEETLVKAFKEFDADGDGRISEAELAAALAKFGVKDDPKKLLESADENKDGHICYAEFCWLMRSHNDDLQTSARTKAKGLLSRFF